MSSYYDRKKKKGMKFRLSFVLLFVFASFIACFTLYMRSDELPAKKEGEIVAITEENTSEEQERTSTADINPIAESAPMDESYFDSCMFAGDSLIVGLGSYGFIPEDRIAANVGMSVMSINSTPLTNPDGSEILAADKINAAAPENLYILLGLNLLGTYTDEQLLAAYGDFIDSIDREKTNIYIISVPPVTGKRETSEDNPILNSDIDSFNSDLLKFANNRCVYYIDLNTALKGSDGRFPEEYAEADGIHFMKSTYRIMLDFLLSHVYSE
ncbi:GDSL-type esterase/lipase family protein [Huintestinicola sp.]|uniref:GDSL-type esterase/lipase family protein n=1 Tax=Huintestinicola sp. TaxID=2981661 RepID=UPI003D7E61C5